MAFRTIEVQLRASVASFTAQMGVAANSVKEFQSDISKAAADNDQFVQSVGKASLVASGALALGLGLAAKSAISFESAFAGVRKTVNGSEAELAALSDGIRDMSKKLPASAVEIASVAEAAGQLGIETGSILSFSRTMIDLGETTNLAATEAATSLARLANITQMPQSEFDRLGSTVAALGNKLETTEAEIVEMGLRLAGAGNQIGLTEAHILGFAGALSSVGIEAEAGGSAISKVMIEIANEVETGGDRLATFAEVAGMSAAQFSAAYREDAAGALVEFIEGLGQMEETGGSTLGVLEDLEITEVRMRDALLRASGAGDLFRQSLELGTAAWEENNALQTEAEQRYATTAAQLEVLRNKVTDLGVDAGSVLLPALNSVVGATGNMADGLASLPAPMTAAATGVAAFSSAGLGVVGTMVLIAPKIKQAQAAMSKMGAVSQFVGANMGKLSLGLAGVGLAVGAGVLIYERATRSAREYADAVKDLTAQFAPVVAGQNSLNDVLEEYIAIQFKDASEEQVQGLNNLGISIADVQDDIMAGGDALDGLREAVVRLGIDLGEWDVGELDDTAMVKPVENMAEAMGISSDEVKNLIEWLEDLDNKAQDSAKAQLTLAVSQGKVSQGAVDAAVENGNYVGALAELFPASSAAASATRTHTSAMDDQADAAAKAEEALQGLIDAYSAPLTPIFAMQDAMRGVEDANRAVRDAQRGYADAQQNVVDASEAVEDAHRGVAEAQRNAQRSVASAQREAVSAAAEIEDAQIEVAKAMSMVADEAEAARRGVANLAAEQQSAVDPLFGMLDALEKQEELLGKTAESAEAVRRAGAPGPGEWNVTKADMSEALSRSGGRLEPGSGGSDTEPPSAVDIARGAAEVTQAATRLAGAIQTGEVSLGESRRMLEEWVKQGLITADQAAKVGAQFDHAAAQADKLQGANVRGAISSEVQAEGMRVAEERAIAVAEAQERVVEATERAADAQERVAEATAEGARSIEDAQARVVDAVDAAADSQEALADAADAVVVAEDRAARSAFELMIASIALSGAIKNNAGLVNDAKQRIKEMGDAGLLTKDQVDRLSRAIDIAAAAAQGYSGEYTARLGLDDREFWERINLARYALALIQIEAQQSGARTAGLQLAAGGITAYAAGGITPAHVTRDQIIKYGEPETGGEAFIPRLGDRTRSMGILDEAASWYGATVVPDAGSGPLPDARRPGGMSAGGTTIVTYVKNTDVRVSVPQSTADRLNERDLGRELDSALWQAGVSS